MKIQYPVVLFKENSHIEFIRDENQLHTCNKRALKNGFHKNLILVDCDSNRYLIENVIKESTTGSFWGFNIFRGQQLKVRLIFHKKKEQLGLDEFQKLLIKNLNKYIDFWDSGGNFEEIIDFIKSTHSTKEIIEKMTIDYYKKY